MVLKNSQRTGVAVLTLLLFCQYPLGKKSKRNKKKAISNPWKNNVLSGYFIAFCRVMGRRSWPYGERVFWATRGPGRKVRPFSELTGLRGQVNQFLIKYYDEILFFQRLARGGCAIILRKDQETDW